LGKTVLNRSAHKHGNYLNKSRKAEWESEEILSYFECFIEVTAAFVTYGWGKSLAYMQQEFEVGANHSEKLMPFLSNTRTEFSPFDQHIPDTSALHVQGISKLTAL
jgi:hypothetical protein